MYFVWTFSQHIDLVPVVNIVLIQRNVIEDLELSRLMLHLTYAIYNNKLVEVFNPNFRPKCKVKVKIFHKPAAYYSLLLIIITILMYAFILINYTTTNMYSVLLV